MILITLSSFLSITVINLYMHVDKTNAVPAWLRKVTGLLDIVVKLLHPVNDNFLLRVQWSAETVYE
jgi:hypothetical protein